MGENERTENMPIEGHPDAWVEKRLADMGLSEADIGNITEGAVGLHAQGCRWWICAGCKSNIDMLTTVKGAIDGSEWPRLLTRAEIECPNCGTYGETFGKNAMNAPHERLKTFKAKQIHNPYPWATRYVRLGKAIVEQNALFPANPDLDPNEPYWPRDLAACIVGAAIIVSSTIKKQGEILSGRPQRTGKKFSNKPKGNPRRPEANGNTRHSD